METRRFITAFTTARHLFLFCQINPVHAHIQLFEDLVYYYYTIYTSVFQLVFFTQVSPPPPK